MKILRLGKNGMVRTQMGTWFNANHISGFYVSDDNPIGTNGWFIIGETHEYGDILLGTFKTFEEAQAELDSLFGEDEARS